MALHLARVWGVCRTSVQGAGTSGKQKGESRAKRGERENSIWTEWTEWVRLNSFCLRKQKELPAAEPGAEICPWGEVALVIHDLGKHLNYFLYKLLLLPGLAKSSNDLSAPIQLLTGWITPYFIWTKSKNKISHPNTYTVDPQHGVQECLPLQSKICI